MAAAVLTLGSFAFAETVDEVFEKLKSAQDSVTSASFTAVTTIEGPMMSVNSTSEVSFLKKDGVRLMRAKTTGKTEVKSMNMTQDSNSLMVSDGTMMWSEQENNGQLMVTKMAVPEGMGDELAGLRGSFPDLSVAGHEEVNGIDCVVLQGAMPGGDGDMKFYVAEASGQIVRTQGTSAQMGTMTTDIKDMKLNVELDESMFQYTPPAGAEVMDMTNMGGMMGEEEVEEAPAPAPGE